MAFPTKFPATFNFRIHVGQFTQQVTKQGNNQYTVKTWVHESGKPACEICNAPELSRTEAIEQLDYQSEYAAQVLENVTA